MRSSHLIYLDNNATTRPLPEVVEAMRPFQETEYANPSSIHQFGQSARHAVESARVQVAEWLGAQPKEVVFTSGGTESINLAIFGALRMDARRRRLVTTAVEHSAVMNAADQLCTLGYDIDYVGVDASGRLDEAEWEAKLTPDTALASILHANNETGVLFDVARLAAVAQQRGIPVHVDAVQSAGKVPVDVNQWPVSFVSLAAHKFHGPKGIGALFVRRKTRLMPMIFGGSQERGLRGGTEHVAGIVGMAAAIQVAQRDSHAVAHRVRNLRDSLETGLLHRIPNTRVNGAGTQRIDNTSNVSFEGLQSEAILILLSEAGICASSGAACSSGSLEPSHVLRAMGTEDRYAHGAIRFSLSRFNTQAEIDEVLSVLPSLLGRLTALKAPTTGRLSDQ